MAAPDDAPDVTAFTEAPPVATWPSPAVYRSTVAPPAADQVDAGKVDDEPPAASAVPSVANSLALVLTENRFIALAV